MKTKLIALFIVGLSVLHASDALTVVSDVISGADGQPLNGSFIIDSPSMTMLGGTVVQKSSKIIQVTNGVINIPLYPNDTSYPKGTSYRISFSLISNVGTLNYKEYWVVPTSSSPVSLSSIRSTSIPIPNLLFSCNQLPTGCNNQPGYVTFPLLVGTTSLTISATQHNLGPNITFIAFDVNGLSVELNPTLDLVGNLSLTWDIPFTSLGSVVVHAGNPLSRNYSSSFTSTTTLSLVGGNNPINNAAYVPYCYDTSSSPLEYNSYSIDLAFNVQVVFPAPSSGRCIFGIQ